MNRRIRLYSWSVILAFAIFQAYAQRYQVGPDGVSYLDLSDAFTGAGLSRLLNTYWSPLYPVAIGIARLIGGAGPARELQTLHAVNLLVFIGLAMAFEYMLMSILTIAARTRHSLLGGPWGLAGVYALFATFAITMIPQELTTPDLLCATAVFVAFGALLRLRAGTSHPARAAIALGAALGLGALAKSFMVPWSLVCFVVLFIATRRGGVRSTVIAIAAWAVFVVPWTAALSRSAHRFTFGDAGRLTYAWYVNTQNAPSLGNVPPGARTERTEAILPGSGATGPAPGTDPMWFDPGRWEQGTIARFNVRDQLGTLRIFVSFYIQNMTPVLFLFVIVMAAGSAARRDAWRNGWVVYVPAVAGIVAYAMVIVTARYIMPFVLSGTLVALATLSRPRRMSPLAVLIGVGTIVALEAIDSRTRLGLALVGSIVGAMVVGVLVPTRVRSLWVIAVVAGLAATRSVLVPEEATLLLAGTSALALVLFIGARAAIRERRPVRFAARLQASMAVALALVLFLRLGLRLTQDAGQFAEAASPNHGNVWLKVADDLQSRGIVPETNIAVIGPHADAYWARLGRLHIVANVPRPRTEDFWRLSLAGRDSLLHVFSAAGARFAIVSVVPDSTIPDDSWTPVPHFRGWLRRLAP